MCENIDFSYRKDQKLFNNLSASFESSHIYGLLGKNGAGKTTLLKCICGLLHPSSGKITIDGKSVFKRLPSILSSIFFLPETFFIPDMSVEQYIKYYSPFYPNFDIKTFEDSSHVLEIENEKKISSFSYGQKKKFLLAFGFATKAPIVILDEPTNGLDIPSKTVIRRKIAESFTEEQSVIISTHQVRDLQQIFDSIIILNDGKIIFNRSLEQIAKNLAIVQVTNDDSKYENTSNYFEQTPIGKIYLTKNEQSSSKEQPIDIEFLFNATINSPDFVNSLFSN
jgi:ABC-2 type transport system ATP-binding protein